MNSAKLTTLCLILGALGNLPSAADKIPVNISVPSSFIWVDADGTESSDAQPVARSPNGGAIKLKFWSSYSLEPAQTLEQQKEAYSKSHSVQEAKLVEHGEDTWTYISLLLLKEELTTSAYILTRARGDELLYVRIIGSREIDWFLSDTATKFIELNSEPETPIPES